MKLKLKEFNPLPEGLVLPEFKPADVGCFLVSLKLDISAFAAQVASLQGALVQGPIAIHALKVIDPYDLPMLLEKGELLAVHGKIIEEKAPEAE